MNDINIQDSLPIGTKLKSPLRTYKIEAVLGGGGFGITYKVSSVIMVENVPVLTFFAVKELFPKGCYRDADKATVIATPSMKNELDECRKDFVVEAKRLNKLSGLSQNIVRVNEVFECFNTAYYVMQFLDGGAMSEHVDANGTLSEAQAMAVIIPLAKAVSLIHKEKLLHLDIKPDNIVMMTSQVDGNRYPVLIDFGIAKHFSSSGKPTSAYAAKGATDGFAPIEQYGNIDSFSPQTDVYALGATLLYFLTGTVPKNAFDITENEIESAIPKEVSKTTRTAILKAMKKLKEQRTPDVQAFIDSLQGEYALTTGTVLVSPVWKYRIVGISEETNSCIIYKALSAMEENSESDRLQIDSSGGNNANKTKKLKTEKQEPKSLPQVSFLLYELFDKKTFKRNDDGSVSGNSGSAQRNFNALCRQLVNVDDVNKFSDDGFPLAETFDANGTSYFSMLIVPKPGAWKRFAKLIGNGASALAVSLRKAGKPVAYVLGAAALAAGLFFGGKALLRACGNSTDAAEDNNNEIVDASQSEDKMNVTGGDSSALEDSKSVDIRDAQQETEPTDVKSVSGEPAISKDHVDAKEPTDDERYLQAVGENNHAELIRLANKNYAKAYYDVANYYFSLKDYSNAKKYAQKAVNANVNRKQAQSLIANIDKAQLPATHDAASKSDAETLAEAKAKGDWTTVRKLADKGYAPAFVPLAANYAQSGLYDAADKYAQAAKRRGIKEAKDVINYLNKLGYYDDKNDSIASF